MSAETSLTRLVSGPILALARRGNEFFDIAFLRQPPPVRWTTPNEVITESEILRLRRFSSSETRTRGAEPAISTSSARFPVLVVPPEVNQSVVVDFGPGQSLVAALIAAGFPEVYAIEWLDPTRDTASRGIDSSIAAILESLDLVARRVHLIGICQGGWEAAIAAALSPSQIATLSLVAAPIDFDAGEGMVKHMARSTPMAVYQALVASGGGVMRGELISGGFDNLMIFERTWLKHLTLWNHLSESAWLERYLRLNDWYRSPKDLPGPLYLRAVKELFKENRLVEGSFVCLGESIDLRRITCPVCLVAGERDHITPPPQVWATKQAVSSKDVLEVQTSGGHIGSFMGRTELSESWPLVFEWLHSRDEA